MIVYSVEMMLTFLRFGAHHNTKYYCSSLDLTQVPAHFWQYSVEQDEKNTSRRLQATDTQEIQSFCEQYCKKHFSDGFESEYK